jgi:glutamine amidotransferase
MKTIAVIDYGMGNLHSVSKAIQKVATKEKVLVTSDIREIKNADRLVLPGVGAIKDCMTALSKDNFHRIILKNISEKPTLAICVGMQMLLQGSEENGGIKGLSLLDGYAKKIKSSETIKDISNGSYFYFVHSYACEVSKDSLALSNHGNDFVSVLSKDTIFAVQFHPEKSQDVGLRLYKNFINWEGS